MENNKKKKYYQYHKNNNHHNYYNYNKHNRYYYKKKKKNHENNYINIDKDINMENVNVGNINHDVIREDNINVNNSNIESDINKKVLYIDENIDYNEYEGLLKKKVVEFNQEKDSKPVLENDSVTMNNQVVNDEPIHIDNNIDINKVDNVTKDIQNNNTNIDLDSILVSKDSVIEKNVNKEDNLVNNNVLDSILPKKEEVKEDNKITYDTLVNVEKEEPKERKSFIIGTKMGYALGVLILVFALFGSTYAFFNYYKEDTRQADITTGEAYVRVLESNLNLSLTNQYPRTEEEARARSDNYIDFNLVGKNTSLTKVLGYNFTLSHGSDVTGKTRISDDYILFDLAELDGSNNETLLLSGVSLSSFNSANISSFIIPTNQTTELQRKYRVRAWISEEVTISDDPEENATYTQAQFANLYANYTLHVNSQDRVLNIGSEAVMKAVNNKIDNNICNPIWIDDMGTANDETDDIIYFSGTNDCVDMNYVWYSGKLWRITAIYPDGAMKLVTENNITSIAFNESGQVNFYTDANTTSYMYQWLNEDFYDTLVNPSNILISDATWNYSTDGNSTPVRPESIATQKTKEAPIGLLNAYEYYNSYRNANTSSNYLNIGYYWWLITSYSDSYVSGVGVTGTMDSSLPARVRAVRPSINLKSGLEFTGSGTINSPYKIVGDKENPSNGTLISSRSVGEYVKFDNDIYRIVSLDENTGTTKLTKVDYLRDNGTGITKYFASSVYFGKSTNTQTDTYWDYYLNNTWYNSISNTYKNMLVDGTYYLGFYGSGEHYKITTCKDDVSTLDNITTKNCTKYTGSDTNKTFTGKVGLPRVGEMFSAQLGGGYSTSKPMWTITPESASYVRYVSTYDGLETSAPKGTKAGVRPSINLKSGIKITGGIGYVGGDTNSPFEISE